MESGPQKLMVDFMGCNRQFDWTEISLIYNESNKYLTLYDSYNVECAAQMIKSF